MSERQTCVLCGWSYADYVVYPVPLASPPKTLIVCLDCVDDLKSLVEERGERVDRQGESLAAVRN